MTVDEDVFPTTTVWRWNLVTTLFSIQFIESRPARQEAEPTATNRGWYPGWNVASILPKKPILIDKNPTGRVSCLDMPWR